jgi:hypothetical protein
MAAGTAAGLGASLLEPLVSPSSFRAAAAADASDSFLAAAALALGSAAAAVTLLHDHADVMTSGHRG